MKQIRVHAHSEKGDSARSKNRLYISREGREMIYKRDNWKCHEWLHAAPRGLPISRHGDLEPPPYSTTSDDRIHRDISSG